MNFGPPYQGQGGGAYYTHQPQYNPMGFGPFNNGDSGSGGPQASSYGLRRNDDLHSLLGTLKSADFDADSYAQFGPILNQAHSVILPMPNHADNFAAPFHQLNNSSKADLLLLQDRLNKMVQAMDAQDKNITHTMGPQYGPNFHSTQMNMGQYQPRALPPGEHTPALSSGSSAYSPGHSPQSDNSPSPASSGMSYPHLQGSASLAAAQMSSVPALGNQFDHIPRRHTGNRLQRAQPASPHDQLMDAESSTAPTQSARVKRDHDINIDPALAGPMSSGSSSTASEGTTTPGQMMASGSGDTQLHRDILLVKTLLEFVGDRLAHHGYDGTDTGSSDNTNNNGYGASDEMEGVLKSGSLYPELPK